MAEDHDGGASVLLSFLLGGMTGAALALLFAPQAGEETRQQIGDRLDEAAGTARELASRGAQVSRDLTERGRELRDEAARYVSSRVSSDAPRTTSESGSRGESAPTAASAFRPRPEESEV